jgi:ParB family transcriptional regulator, chromosome partitioning protein
MVSKFNQKAAGVRFNLDQPEAAAPPAPQEVPDRKRTAIGMHADALYRDRELIEKNARLEQALKDHDGALPTKLLDPNDIFLSKFHNRHPDSYKDKEFMELEEEIAAAGGNTVPIGVRPLPGQPGKYELGFGSRRRQCCLNRGLPVLALIEEMDEAGLFERMERENRNRKNLRPYEQGMMYAKALEEKVYPSATKMAAALQIDPTGLGRLLSIAKLPPAVLDAFESPLDIQFDWGGMLNTALQTAPDPVLSMAEKIKTLPTRPSAKAVLEQLLQAADPGGAQRSLPAETLIAGAASQSAKIRFGPSGKVSVTMKNVPPEKKARLEELIKGFLA